MARKKNYGKFTNRRRAALRKAQLASARKRKRRGNLLMGGAGVLAGAGAAYVVLGRRTNSLQSTPGGTAAPAQTDPNKNAKETIDGLLRKEKNRDYIDPNTATSRLRNKGKTPAQQTGGLTKKPKSGTSSQAAQILEAAKPGQLTLDIPLAALSTKPKKNQEPLSASNPNYKPRSLVDVIQNPSLHDQILGWRIYSPQMQAHTRALVAEHGFKISESDKINRGGVLYKPRTKQQKAADTRRRRAAAAAQGG